MPVQVRFNNLEQALKKLKKKMQLEGVFKVMRNKRAYEKPSWKKKRKKEEADRRRSKLARKFNNNWS